MPRRSNVHRRLTELEACALAVVWRRGPCSAYAVRREFDNSISSSWSSSAGTIYPSISRLEALGLVSSSPLPGDKRGSRLLRATTAGLAAVRQWIENPPDASPPPDPIRTRMFFVDALDGRARRAFVEQAERATSTALEQAEARIASFSDENLPDRLSTMGSAHALRARLAWLNEVRRQLNSIGKR